MGELVGKTVVSAVGVSVAAWLLSGIQLGRPGDSLGTRVVTALLVGLVLALLNKVVRPLLTFLSWPFLILTLGLFWFVISAVTLWLTSRISGSVGLSFHVDDFWWQAVLGAVVIAVMGAVTEPLLAPPRRADRRREARRRER